MPSAADVSPTPCRTGVTRKVCVKLVFMDCALSNKGDGRRQAPRAPGVRPSAGRFAMVLDIWRCAAALVDPRRPGQQRAPQPIPPAERRSGRAGRRSIPREPLRWSPPLILTIRTAMSDPEMRCSDPPLVAHGAGRRQCRSWAASGGRDDPPALGRPARARPSRASPWIACCGECGGPATGMAVARTNARQGLYLPGAVGNCLESFGAAVTPGVQ